MASNDEIRKSLLILLRPLVKFNFILGTCPCLISSDGSILTPLKLFNFSRFFLIVLFFLSLSVSSVIKAFIIFSSKSEQVEGSTTLKIFVDMSCWFYTYLIPAVFLGIASCKRRQILSFIESITKYANGVSGFGDYAHVKRVTRRLFVMHGVFGVAISSMICVRFIMSPTFGPGHLPFWFLKWGQDDEHVALVNWLSLPICIYLSVAKTAVTAFIEVCCVSLAACFCKVIENVQVYLDDVMENWNGRFFELGVPSFRKLECTSQNSSMKKEDEGDQGKVRRTHNDFENYMEQLKQFNYNGFLPPLLPPKMEGRSQGDFREMTPGQQIVLVVDKIQSVRNMQQTVNDLFGVVLALNTGLMVFLSVVLKYMLIENSSNLIGLNNNGNSTQPDFDRTGSMLHPNSTSDWAAFYILDTCFEMRLLLLIICLGNVHHTSQKFNSKLSQALLQAQKISDIVEVQGMSTKYFGERQVITANEANVALAFITENSANPVCFSAAGLFCYSRNLILVIFSIIITYLVFLLQV